MPDLYIAKDEPNSQPFSEDTNEDSVTPAVAHDSKKDTACKRKPEDYSEVIRTEKQSLNPFAAFAVKPKNVFLIVQESEEEILLLLRRHIITNVRWVLIAFLLILAPLTLTFFPILAPLPANFKIMTLIFWYLITLAFIIEQFLSWYFNVYIVTDERIIDVDFLNLLYRNISTAKIENIEDITYEITGGIRNLLNFGTVSMQTAGEKRELAFEDVPQPQKVVKLLNELILEEEQEKIEGRVR